MVCTRAQESARIVVQGRSVAGVLQQGLWETGTKSGRDRTIYLASVQGLNKLCRTTLHPVVERSWTNS